MRASHATAFREGAAAAAPQLLGVVPWGLVTGVAMSSAGLSVPQAVAMGLLIFAGAAQLAVLPLFVAQAPLWLMLLTVGVVNLRYVIYSAGLAPHFQHLPRGWRALLSYVTVDGTFALFVGRYPPGDRTPDRHWFFLGGSLAMWCTWQASSWAGIYAGALIPKSWSLEFAGTLGLIALLRPVLFDRAALWGSLAAGAAALAAAGLPLKLGLLVGIAAGTATGLAFAFHSRRASPG
jgi:predicted branched-subunit amino acid permease